MNLDRVNLNLLVALDELLTAQSVTVAAKKLFLTQAALSNNLQQLREIFKDPLLVREKNYMVLTQYAKELRPKLHQVLQEMHSLLISGQRFEPSTSTRLFKIGMSDYMASLILPKLSKILSQQAPEIKIQIISDTHIGSAEPFEKGDYELALSKIFEHKKGLCYQPLFSDTGVCILNPRHPLAKKKKITLKEYLSYHHVAAQADHPNTPRLIEEALEKQGAHREISIGSPFIHPILDIIAHSETLIGTVIKRVAEAYYTPDRFVIKALPFEMTPIPFYLLWHQRHDSDIGHRWLREQIAAVIV